MTEPLKQVPGHIKGGGKMAYSEVLAERVAQALGDTPKVETKKMMGGLTFMVDSKMCVDFNKRAKASKRKKGA